MRYSAMRHPARPIGIENYTFRYSSGKQNVAARLNPAEWALTFMGAIVGLKEYKDSAWYRNSYLYVVTDRTESGKYIKVRRISKDGEFTSLRGSWTYAAAYYRAYDSVAIMQMEFKLEQMQAEVDRAKAEAAGIAKQQLSQLSQNTVTRALVHAYSNDYCHETAVALISAGHKMPDVTLELEVTVPVSITLKGNDSYYALREIFGRTSGNVDGAKGLDLMNGRGQDKIAQAINEQIQRDGISYYNSTVTHQDTSVDWKDPILRTVPERDAMREVSSYGLD